MKKEPTFEESISRLTQIVEALEHDGTALAEAMKLYEEGIELSQKCRHELESAEQRITELRARAEGGLEEEELEF
jgi:exodeoxyribonuclease VII small subunit